MTAYQHQVRFGVEHARVHGCIPVVEGDYVEDDSLWYCQDEWQHPNRNNLNDCEERDAHSLYPAPGGHGPVPVSQEDTR